MYFSTRENNVENKILAWLDRLFRANFLLSAECNKQKTFDGALNTWFLCIRDLSEIECGGILNRRRNPLFINENDYSLPITVPHDGDVRFQKNRSETKCDPDGFLVEFGNIAYEFWQPKRNKLCVLKVSMESVRSRLGAVGRLSALAFAGTKSVGSHLIEAAKNVIARFSEIKRATRKIAGQYLHLLLCLSVGNDERIPRGYSSDMRANHLQNALQCINENLAYLKLTSGIIAKRCGIYQRYLQQLFSETGYSVASYLRKMRLPRRHEALKSVNASDSKAAIALIWAFYDHPQFCKNHHKQFGCTPSETRKHSQHVLASQNIITVLN